MKLDLSHSNNSLPALEVVWILELLWIFVAQLLFSISPRQGVCIAVGLALLALSFLQRWAVTGRPSRATAFDAPWVLLLVGAVVSLAASYDPALSRPVALVLTGYVALYYVAANTPKPTVLAQAALLVGVPVAAYFLSQYQYIPHTDKSHLASSLGRLVSQPFPRLGSWQPFPNSVATLLEGLIPLGVALTLSRRSWGWRVISGLATGTIGLAVLIAASRGAWVALFVSALLWLASRRRWSFIALSGAALAAFLTIGGYLMIVEGATLLSVPAIGPILYQLFARPDRLEAYQGSMRLIQDFPLTGIGLGEVFAPVYSKYILLIPNVFLPYSHNLYLSIWLGHGFLGILGTGWLVVAFGYLVTRENRKGRPSPSPRLGSGQVFQAAWTGVVVILIHGLFDALQYVALWTMWPLFFLLGLTVSCSTVRADKKAMTVRQKAHLRRWASIALALLAVGCALLWRPLAAMAYANLGAIEQAKAELSDSLTQDARDAYLQAATASYGRALLLDADNRAANLRLGNLAVADDRYEEGIAYLEIAWQLAPADPTARKALGLAYTWVGETDRAAALLQGTRDIVEELNVWAWWHGQEGRGQAALNAYRTSLALEPDQPQIQDRLSALENQ